MSAENQSVSAGTDAEEIVLSFIKAMNDEDFEKAATYVTHDLLFVGVMGTRNGAESYFNDMKKMKFKYDIKKSIVEDNDVCLFYDIDMGGVTIFSCGWYQLEKGKIKSFRVIFDPRPLLEHIAKQSKSN